MTPVPLLHEQDEMVSCYYGLVMLSLLYHPLEMLCGTRALSSGEKTVIGTRRNSRNQILYYGIDIRDNSFNLFEHVYRSEFAWKAVVTFLLEI